MLKSVKSISCSVFGKNTEFTVFTVGLGNLCFGEFNQPLLFLTVSLVVRTSSSLVVFVDSFQHSVVNRMIRRELKPILPYLCKYRRSAKFTYENLISRNSSVLESHLEFLLCKGFTVQSHSKGVDCLDMIFSHECVLSHSLVLLFSVEFVVESFSK